MIMDHLCSKKPWLTLLLDIGSKIKKSVENNPFKTMLSDSALEEWIK